MEPDPLDRMRQRIDQCLRLAAMVHQDEARDILLKMAAEGEADLQRLLDERGANAADVA